MGDVGLHAGDKIEVEWHVVPAEGEPYNRWWRATLMGPVAPETTATTSPAKAAAATSAGDDRHAGPRQGETAAAAAAPGNSSSHDATVSEGARPAEAAAVEGAPAAATTPLPGAQSAQTSRPDADGGTAGSAQPAAAGRAADPVYEILYDAFEEFDQDRATISFTSKRRLLDSEQSGKMVWRKVGQEAAAPGDDSSDDFEDDGEDSGVEGDAGERAYTIQEYADASDIDDSDEAVAAAMSTVPPEKQRIIAESFLQFKEEFTSFMSDMLNARQGSDESKVITAKDIEGFTARLKRRRMQ